MVGQPVIWGLAYNGRAGVAEVLKILNEEFDIAMALCGCASIADITADLLQPPPDSVVWMTRGPSTRL
jgi:4-hydroxymandelate oxidase